jgi:putative ABC transport system ATP-binding protein
MDTRFIRFVWRHSKREQLIILAITFATFPFVYLSLELPKIIVNDAIDGSDFPRVILGVEIPQIPYLLLLCVVFLALVIAINVFKWFLNVAIGMCGERMLRRLRFMLFERVMRFRMRRFRKMKPGEVIQSMLGEIEPLGGFIGEVVATPAFQGGLLVVYAVFIFVQDVWLGLAAVAFYPLQAWLIPKLQAKVIRLNRERARTNRQLADRIAESVDKIADIHTNDTPRWHMAQIAGRLHRLTMIRLDIYKRKFTIKFINNLINQLIPFFFYAVGGYLVIKGELDFGSLVAVLAAYKDLAAPWKAVLTYWQRWADFNGRFTYVVEGFLGDDVMGPERVHAYPAAPLEGPMVLEDVEGGPGSGGLAVPRLSVSPGETVAVREGAEGAREALLRLMAGLEEPAAGRVVVGGRSLAEATLPEIGATISYVGSEPGIITGSLRENLLYGLYRNPPGLDPGADAEAAELLREARATGNPTTDADGDWVDYAAAGVAGPGELDARLLDLVEKADLADEVFAAGLGRRLGPEEAERWQAPILHARARLRAEAGDLSDAVEPWEADSYNTNGPLLHNLLFALPVTGETSVEAYGADPRVAHVIREIGAVALLEEIGWDIAQEFAELVEALEENSPVLDSFQGYARAEVEGAAAIVAAHPGQALSALDESEREILRTLALKYVETRDRLDVLDAGRKARVLEARRAARDAVAAREDFVGFDEETVNPARTVAGNILNGQRRLDRRSAWRGLDEAIARVVESEGLRPEILRLGLEVPAADAGLTASGRRRLALVRGLLSRPRFLILDGVAGGEGAADAALRAAIREAQPGLCLVYAADGAGATADAGRVLAIDETGRLAGRQGEGTA